MDRKQAERLMGDFNARKASPIELEPVATHDGYVAAWSRWIWDDRAQDWDQPFIAASSVAHQSVEACRAEIVAMLAGGH